MHYRGPSPTDFANVLVLNRAFIAWQRAKPPRPMQAPPASAEIRSRLSRLTGKQREHLARTPFLLMSLAEDDEARWQSLFAERQTRDMLQCAQTRDETATRLMAAGLGFLWQLAHRNPYAVRLVSGASVAWCEQLASCTLMDLFARAMEDPALLVPRLAGNADLWDKLLGAGISDRRDLRRAGRVTALQTMLTRCPVRTCRPLAAAACRMPQAATIKSGKRGT